MSNIPLGRLGEERRPRNADDDFPTQAVDRDRNDATVSVLRDQALSAGLAAIGVALNAAETARTKGSTAAIATELCDLANQTTKAAHSYAAGAIYLKDDESDLDRGRGTSPCGPLAVQVGGSRSSDTRSGPDRGDLSRR